MSVRIVGRYTLLRLLELEAEMNELRKRLVEMEQKDKK